jgi:hypothetical protein
VKKAQSSNQPVPLLTQATGRHVGSRIRQGLRWKPSLLIKSRMLIRKDQRTKIKEKKPAARNQYPEFNIQLIISEIRLIGVIRGKKNIPL